MAESDNDKFGGYLFVNCFIYFILDNSELPSEIVVKFVKGKHVYNYRT